MTSPSKARGTPIPRTGRSRRWHPGRGRNHGVSANSRILPHRYADEGDKGQWFRRVIRRREKAMWVREVRDDD